MCIKKDGKRWIVCKFVPEHNHVLLTPRSTSLLHGHRGVTRVQKKLILTLNESSIPTRKIMSVLSKESGGDFNTGCISKDVKNYLGNKRRKLFEEGDAQRLYAYFLDRQCKEPEFVYSMQIDENGCMGSCFWADARSRFAYQYFGDVVTFDATYLTNIYKMPFVPFSGFPGFQKEFRHCIHETITCDEFVEEWSSTMTKYGLVGNDWLENLYNRREKWVPTYLRTTFCAGMSTTQRSESMNKFFKDYVRSSTMVSDFVHQYEKALDARYFKEKEKDMKTKSTKAVLKTCWAIEEEAASMYTRKSFEIFQDELFNSQRYKASKVQKEGESKMYAVAPNGKEKRIYYVTLESGEVKAICTCHMFEFLGIVCRHILCVLTKKSKLDRWTINAKSRAILEIPVSEGHVMTQEDSIMRKNKLMMQFYDIAELGSQSSFAMNHLSLTLEKVHNELFLMENIGEKNFERDMSHADSPMLRS
ncbi:hypothetical protein I3843_11G153900 [Carya illinoinensis]|nr:hypothetical protein I3843_11G153900 [Carya illinoinensis]